MGYQAHEVEKSSDFEVRVVYQNHEVENSSEFFDCEDTSVEELSGFFSSQSFHSE